MNKLLYILAFAFVTGCAPKKTIQQPMPEQTTMPVPAPEGMDSIPVVKDTTVLPASPKEAADNKVPDCIQKMIADISKDPVQNPPRKIFSYSYKGKTVYYLTSVCCDQYSNLYDDKCNLLGHPDGGFTGRGDGKFPNFSKEATNEKLVWADKRK